MTPIRLLGDNMIKLLHLYNFGDISNSDNFDYSGLWETVGVKGFSTSTPTWTLRRAASFTVGGKVGEKIEIPQVIIEMFGSCVNRSSLKGVRVHKPNKAMNSDK